MCIVIIKLNSCLHTSVYALREVLNVVFPSQPCHFKKNIINIIIHNVDFFKFRAGDKSSSLRKPKEESTNERQE